MQLVNDPFDRLTERRKECLRLVLTGRSAKQIGPLLGISPGTVEQHLKTARSILGVSDSGTAARMLAAYEHGHIQKLGIQPSPLAEPAENRRSGSPSEQQARGRELSGSAMEDRVVFDTIMPFRPSGGYHGPSPGVDAKMIWASWRGWRRRWVSQPPFRSRSPSF